jgi:hypothetical protein
MRSEPPFARSTPAGARSRVRFPPDQARAKLRPGADRGAGARPRTVPFAPMLTSC